MFRGRINEVPDATLPSTVAPPSPKRRKISTDDPEGHLYLRRSRFTLRTRAIKISHEQTPGLVGRFIGGDASYVHTQLMKEGRKAEAEELDQDHTLALHWRLQQGIHVVYAEDADGSELFIGPTLRLKVGCVIYMGCAVCAVRADVHCNCLDALGHCDSLHMPFVDFHLDEFSVPSHMHNFAWGPSQNTECCGVLNLHQFAGATMVGLVP